MKKLFLLLSLILSLASFISCEKEPDPVFGVMRENAPDQEAEIIHIIERNDSLLVREVFAKKMDIYEEEKYTIADTIKLIGFKEDGSWEYTITGNRAKIDNKSEKIELFDDVVINSEAGKLFAQYLIWDRATDKVNVPGDVTLIRNNHTVHGKKMTTNVNFDYINMIEVKAKGEINEKNLND